MGTAQAERLDRAMRLGWTKVETPADDWSVLDYQLTLNSGTKRCIVFVRNGEHVSLLALTAEQRASIPQAVIDQFNALRRDAGYYTI